MVPHIARTTRLSKSPKKKPHFATFQSPKIKRKVKSQKVKKPKSQKVKKSKSQTVQSQKSNVKSNLTK